MPRRYSMDTRQRAAQDARDRILEAALDELAACGSEAITLQSVADRADVAVRTLYNHFANRNELLTAAFLHHTSQTRQAVEALRVPDADPDEQLRHVVGAYYRRYAQMGPRLAVLLSLRGAPELDREILAIRDWRRQLLTTIIDRAHRQGTLAVPVPSALALAFTLTSYAGWQTLHDAAGGGPEEAHLVAVEVLESALFHR